MRRRYTPVAVSAPSSTRTHVARSFALLAIAFVVASCAAPGAGRLQGAPAGMPPALEHVTADVLGFTLYDTDPGSTRWESTGLPADDVLAALYDTIGQDADAVEPWIGDHAGIALRQLDVPGTEGATSVFFADVRDRDALDAAMDELRGAGRAVEAWDDAVVIAPSADALDDFVDAAGEYAASDRRAMRDYAAKVATTVPVGVVFRFDLVRTHARRPFEGNPALLEFARWATESDVLLATRDGWLGIAPPLDDARVGTAVRVVGNVEWVPDLAEEIDWGSANPDLLDTADEQADVVVSFDDPGQHLAQLLEGITRRNGQYATDQDVPDEDERPEVEPLFEKLGGAAVLQWDRGLLRLFVVDGAQGITQLDAAIRQVLPGARVADRGGNLEVVVPLRQDRIDGDLRSDRAQALQGSGKPPSDPIAWLWTRSLGRCSGPAAGWVAFDGVGEMTMSLDATLADDCSPAELVPFA